MTRYDDLYSANPDYFGTDPSSILADFCHLIDRSRPTLDIGAGQGRHAVYLARRGFVVDAIDPSSVGIAGPENLARSENLKLATHTVGFEHFQRPDGYYSAVLLFGIIQEHDWKSIDLLVGKVHSWLMRGGLVFVTAFTQEDPSFERFSSGVRIGRNSFVNARGITRTFLETDEILRLFSGYEPVFHREELGPIHVHGNNPPERHGTAQAVLRKP